MEANSHLSRANECYQEIEKPRRNRCNKKELLYAYCSGQSVVDYMEYMVFMWRVGMAGTYTRLNSTPMILKCDMTAVMTRIALWESYIVGQRKRTVGVDFVEVKADLRSLVLLLIGVSSPIWPE